MPLSSQLGIYSVGLSSSTYWSERVATTAGTNSTTTCTVTTSAAHGLAVGDTVVIEGTTPAAYSGTFVITAVPSATTFTYTALSNPGGNITVQGTVGGWGVQGATVTRFYEFESEGLEPNAERFEAATLRASTRGMRDDRFFPFVTSHEGSVKLPVMTKGFGLWLPHLMGTATVDGSVSDSVYDHTGTVGSLCTDSFTMQLNRPLGACGDTDQAFTYYGCKVSEWTLSMEQMGVLQLEATVIAKSALTSVALASASYASSMEFMPFSTCTLSIGGTTVKVKSWSVKSNPGLATDRTFVRGNAQIAEPVESSLRDVEFSATLDFESLVQYNRVVSATAAGAVAAVVIQANGPTLAGSSSYPGLRINMDSVRFDQATNNVSGADVIEQSLTGKALVPAAGGDQLKLTYTTTDSTL